MGDVKSIVQSAAKTFAVLRAFTADRNELTITEVATAAGLDRGTSFRLINTLVSLGYLAPVAGTRRFRLTLRCLDLGYAALTGGGLTGMARPLLADMVPDLADAASLGMLDGGDVVYMERVQTDLGRRDLDRRPGSRTGAYAAALGHVLLAWLPAADALAILAATPRVPLSERTLTDVDALTARLAEVRAAGYAVSDGENAYGLRTIAAPILDLDGRARAGISLTVRSERITLDAFIAATLPSLLEMTGALTAAVRQTGADLPMRRVG